MAWVTGASIARRSALPELITAATQVSISLTVGLCTITSVGASSPYRRT